MNKQTFSSLSMSWLMNVKHPKGIAYSNSKLLYYAGFSLELGQSETPLLSLVSILSPRIRRGLHKIEFKGYVACSWVNNSEYNEK